MLRNKNMFWQKKFGSLLGLIAEVSMVCERAAGACML